MVVGSKWGYVYTADWEVDADPPEVKHHDADTLRRQLEETRARLGDHLELYQIHSATPDSGVLENDAVLGELRDLRASGVAIGVSVSGTSQPETIDRAVALGCSTRSRRPGTCTSARPARRWGAPTTRAWP